MLHIAAAYFLSYASEFFNSVREFAISPLYVIVAYNTSRYICCSTIKFNVVELVKVQVAGVPPSLAKRQGHSISK